MIVIGNVRSKSMTILVNEDGKTVESPDCGSTDNKRDKNYLSASQEEFSNELISRLVRELVVIRANGRFGRTLPLQILKLFKIEKCVASAVHASSNSLPSNESLVALMY